MAHEQRAPSTLTAPPDRQGANVSEFQGRRLMLAVEEVVGESGVEAATVGRVCEQAGVSRRTFYEIYANREECLLAAVDSRLERLTELAGAAYAHPGSWVERVRGVLALVLEHLDAEPNVARMLVVETLRAGPVVLEQRRRALEALAVVVDEGRVAARAGADPPPLTAEGIVGGALSVIHARLLSSAADFSTPDGGARPLVELTGSLMAMIVHPYLGQAAACKELKRPTPASGSLTTRPGGEPFKGLPIRFTYRTALVMATIASDPGASNRYIADRAGIADEGQTSRLLRRLQSCELIENRGAGHPKGSPNAWALTERGEAVHATIAVNGATG